MEIPEEELEERFVRSSGAGGQHVNKVSSAVQLRWNVESSQIDAGIKRKFYKRWANRITVNGDIIIEASAHRSQHRNRQAARARLHKMLLKALETEKPRVPTRPSRGAVKKRLKDKKIRSETKARRGRVLRDLD